MTRINLVPPSELSRQHLIAEYRELPRVFALSQKARDRGERPDDKRNPRAYTLGTGHVRFFYTRLTFLQKRLDALIEEMDRRGYQANYRTKFPLDFPGWNADYVPTEEALEVNRARIKERS